jgi:hypothetical protein
MNQMNIRVKEFKQIPAGKLRANPDNWRRHPVEQRAALEGLLSEVGFAGALLARKDENGALILIDGHLRKEIADDAKVPVLITDLTEAEADLLLASYDPIASMATADEAKLQELIARIEVEDESLKGLLGKIKVADALPSIENIPPDLTPTNIEEHWKGMPDYQHEDLTSYRKIIVHFRNEGDVKAFSELVNQELTDKTRFVWYPKADIETMADKRWEDEP